MQVLFMKFQIEDLHIKWRQEPQQMVFVIPPKGRMFYVSLPWVLLFVTCCQGLDVSNLPVSGSMTQLDDEDIERVTLELVETSQDRMYYRLHRKQTHNNLTLYENKDLTVPGCRVFKRTSAGIPHVRPCPTTDCHYIGHVDNDRSSRLALSGCKALEGFMEIDDKAVYLEPSEVRVVGGGSTHIMYSFDALAEDNQQCPVPGLREIDPPSPSPPADETFREVNNLKRRWFVETAIVIDPSMTYPHIDYIYMLINIVSQLYKDESLGQDVQVTLHSIHYMSFEEANWKESGTLEKTLCQFCSWQQNVSFYDDYPPDCAILMKNISGNKLGLAYRYGMCRSEIRCGIVKDSGPQGAFGMAHEMGHLLGMGHDDDDGCVSMIMGSRGASGPNSYKWSSCSRAGIHKFLISEKASRCLEDEPKGYSNNLTSPRQLPGHLYTADEQCHAVNGHKTRFHYSNNDPCPNLNCAYNGTSFIMNTQPLMDGTDINNTRTMCYHGRAVAMDSSICNGSILCPEPINGSYTEWGTFTTCSRTCGGGVRISRRYCTNPPARYGGHRCEGPSEKIMLCNLQPCEEVRNPCKDVPGSDGGQGQPGGNCLVYCPLGNNTFRPLPLKNWEECEPLDIFSRCNTNGSCRTFGCDGHMDSGLGYDNCGHCDGDGTGCTKVDGNFSTQQPSIDNCTDLGETDPRQNCTPSNSGCYGVHVVPKGSTNIVVVISYARPDRCALAVLINGTKHSDFKSTGNYLLSGITIHYTPLPQKINIAGPTPFDIEIQVHRCPRNHCLTAYEYYVPTRMHQYEWSVSYPRCSRSCGTGVEDPLIRCTNMSSFVDDVFCDFRNKPSEVSIKCNSKPCLRWHVSPWSACSLTCGAGMRTRNVWCVEETFEGGFLRGAPRSNCSRSEMPKTKGRCYDRPCITHWWTGNWTECSKTCGEGIQRRAVLCRDQNGMHVESHWCNDETMPYYQKKCISSCIIDCGPVPRLTNGSALPPVRTTIGSVVRYGCDAGYRLEGPVSSINCTKYGNWSVVPRCVKDQCVDVRQNCSSYDPKYCEDLLYRPFWFAYCRKYCGLC